MPSTSRQIQAVGRVAILLLFAFFSGHLLVARPYDRACVKGIKGYNVTVSYNEDDLSDGSLSMREYLTNANGFVAKSAFSLSDIYDQTVWPAPAMLCSNAASLNLTSLLTPYQSGGAMAVVNYSNVNSPTGAQGFVTGSYATFNSGGYVTLDLGVTVPAGATISILWKSAGGNATATVLSGITNPTTIVESSFTTSSTADVYSTIELTSSARYIRLTRSSSSSTFYVDGVYYEYGNAMGGTWSGTGVTGNTFNPTGLSGPIAITYTVGVAPNAMTTTNTINVVSAPVGGTISSSSVGTQCPGSNSGILTLAGYNGDIIGWLSSTDGFLTNTAIPNTTNTLAFTDLNSTTQYRARIGVTGCGNVASATYTVQVNDNVSPVITTCPPAQTIVLSTTCQATIPDLIPNAAGSDNCSSALFWAQSPVAGSVVSKGTHIVTIRATDAAGNTTTCSVTITAVDTIAPIISGCPMDIVLNASAGQCTASYNFIAPTATDECGTVTTTSAITNVDGTAIPGPMLGSQYNVGVTTRTFTFTDASGNSSTCSFTVTVVDNQSPTVNNCLSNFNTPADLGSCGANVSYAVPTFSDNCLFRVDLTQGPGSGEFFPVGTTQVTYVATDSSSRTMSCSFNVTVQDLQVPLFTACPSNISVQAPLAATGTTVNWTAPSTSDNCSVTSMTQTTGQAPGSYFTIGTQTITYTATDINGNISVCTFWVNVTSNDAPTILCPANEVLYSTVTSCSPTFTYATPLVSDDQPLPTGQPTQIDGSGYTSASGFPLGTTDQIWRVTDINANSTTCSFTVQVIDTIKPIFTNCPSSLTLDADPGQCGAVLNYVFPSATDNCTGPVVVVRTAGLAAGDLFPIGSTLVRFRATEPSGNFSICSFTVTVVDNQPPTLADCPADINVSADANTCGALVTFDSPTFSDNCTVTLSQTGPVSGSIFPLGDTPVQFIATDAEGLTATCSFNVHVDDTSVPTFTYCPSTIYATSDLGSCGAIVNYAPPEATDNCNFVLSVPPAVSSGSFFPVGSTLVTYTATDGTNAPVVCSFNIDVIDNQDPSIVGMPVNIEVPTDPNSCGAVVTWTDPTANDNCSAALAADHVSGDIFPLGTTVVNYTADDGSNTTSESFLITVTDMEGPSITCAADEVLSSDASYCGAIMPNAMANATDNCTLDSIWQTSGPRAGDTLAVSASPYIVGWSAVDISGNITSCTRSISVIDVDPPTVICDLYDSIEYYLDSNCQLAFPDLRDSVIVRDCSAWSNNMWPLAGTIFTQDTLIHMTMAITDIHGTLVNNDHLIWIRDTIAPVITCPSAVNVTAPPGDCTAIATFSATAVDNCGGSASVAYSQASGSAFSIGPNTVTATASDAGRTATCEFQVNVITATVDLSYGVSTICTSAASISPITASPIGGVFSDATQAGTINVTTGQFDPTNADAGIHTLRYMFNSGGCIVQDSFAIEVIASPDPGTDGVLSICVSSSDVSLFDQLAGSPQTGGSWTGPSTVINGHYDPATMIPGDYVYTINGTPPCGDLSARVSVSEIANPPTPTITGPNSYCTGSSVTLISSSATGNLWSPGNETTQSISVNAIGTYSVTVTANGCSATSANKVIAEQALPPTPTISGPNTVCTGSSITLTSSAADGNNWSQFGFDQDLSVWGPGTYYVIVTENDCQARSADFVITEIPTTSNTTSIAACDTYTWSENGQTYINSGTYSNTVGCHTEILELTITPSTENTTTITACDTYTWSANGQSYINSGTYSNTVGCHTEILELTITPSSSVTTAITACDTYTWSASGQVYTTSGTYSNTVGCDTQILELTITPSTDNTTTITACDTYTWSANGQSYINSGTYSNTVGCHTEILELTITSSSSVTTTITTCDTYTWSASGQVYTTSGTYSNTIGCNTEILELTITLSSSVTTTITVCDTYTWSANGQTYTTSGTYSNTVGCDTQILELTITQSTDNTTTIASCDTYTWSANGQSYINSGIYSNTVGCHTEILELTITPSSSVTTAITACDTYIWSANGQVYTTSGTYSNTVGCDTEILELTITPSTSVTTTITACDTYTWSANGQTYTTSGTYSNTVGCDTEILELTITPSSSVTTTTSACDNYTWNANGQTYTTTGTYSNNVGCDTQILELTITPSSSVTTTITACDTYTWSANGQFYTTSGTYSNTIGCDTEILELTITPSSSVSTTITACDTYTWSANGQVYTTSGTYSNTVGCDTEILELTITPSSSVTTTITACDTYTWSANGQVFTTSGTYSNTVGCDTEILELTITPSTSVTTMITACDTYTWSANGQFYTTSGTYSNTIGCDTEILELTITPSSSVTTTITACDTYTWSANGQVYTTSGTYSNTVGCDTEILELTITPSASVTTTITACDNYTWSANGQSYTTSGTYSNTVGCDTEILELTITPSSSVTTTIIACETYTWSANGQTYTTSGTYSNTVGCDTEILELTITPSSSVSTTIAACDTYTWSANGQAYTTSGTYSNTVGCDTQILELTITPSSSVTTTITACDTYTWSANGQTYTTSGTYSNTVGCDTEILELTITPSSSVSTTIAACDTYTWSANGQAYTTSGTYSNTVGCDTQILELTITPSSSVTTTITACGTYTWSGNGQVYTTSGTHSNTVGCDTEILELTITPSSSVTTTISACETYTWSVNGQVYTASGTYSNTVGCDTEILDLTITPLASAEFNYAQSIYCNGEMPPTPFTVSTGTFTTLESGLIINSGTGEINIQGSTPGTYHVIHTTGDICSDTDTATITIVRQLNANWTLPTSVCQGAASIDLQAYVTGDAIGTWSGPGMNGSTFNPTASGAYQLTYTVEEQGCTTSSTLDYLVLGAVQANAGPDSTICGNSMQLNANTSSFGHWIVPSNIAASSSTSANAVVNTTQFGTYALVWAIDNGSCSGADTVNITFMDPGAAIWVDAGPDQNLEVLDHSELNGQGTDGATFEWSILSGGGYIHEPNSMNSAITDLALGDNVFILTANMGICSTKQDTLVIHVDDLFIPQALSPNGDGDNDLFVITGMDAYPNSTLTVFNRWGLKVYHNSDYANEWDGRSKNGMELPNDTYFYVLNLSNSRAYNGFVIIKR